jgi:hypothetical protein
MMSIDMHEEDNFTGIDGIEAGVKVQTQGATQTQNSTTQKGAAGWKRRKYGTLYFVGAFSVLVFVVEIGAIMWILYGGSTTTESRWVDIVLGTLLAHITTVIQFWIGSSQGSASKQSYMENVASKAADRTKLG